MATILVATDGSATAAAAVEEAVDLARRRGDSLVAVTVVKPSFPSPSHGAGVRSPVRPRPASSAVYAEAERVIADVLTRARDAGVDAEGIVVTGLPAAEICRLASARDARTIVIGSHGRSPVRRLVFGSVSTAVLHHSSKPVLVVPAGKDERLGDARTTVEGTPA